MSIELTTKTGKSKLLNSYFVSVFTGEEGGDLLKLGISFPGTPEEKLGTDVIFQITYTK